MLPLLAQAAFAQERVVFAHFMHGLTAAYTPVQWAEDISLAKAAGIDGFALNIGPHDAWTEPQLDSAYSEAEKAGFKMLISFDQLCCGPWNPTEVTRLINKYKNRTSQMRVNNLPFVSTFEGAGFADNWAQVRQETGGIYLVPDWASLGLGGFKKHLEKVGGAFAWDAWSTNTKQKTTESDVAWMDMLGGKAYMMAVSPWFYTNLPQFNKNWMWKSDSLWYTRWEQVLDLKPEFVEIISWNDYGESHYVGPIVPGSVVSGAERFVNNMPHDGWRFLLPYYISAYKAGTRDVPVPTEGLVYWYRRTSTSACSDGGTTCSPPGYPAQYRAEECADDAVFVASLAREPAEVEVAIGGQVASRSQVRRGAGFVQVPFAGRTGEVTVRLLKGGKAVAEGKGEPVENACVGGQVNFNAWVGLAKAA